MSKQIAAKTPEWSRVYKPWKSTGVLASPKAAELCSAEEGVDYAVCREHPLYFVDPHTECSKCREPPCDFNEKTIAGSAEG